MMLIGNAALLLQVDVGSPRVPPQDVGKMDHSVTAALQALVKLSPGVLVLVLFSLVLAAILVQAFEFEIIRLLEGYAPQGIPGVRRVMLIRVRRHQHKLGGLESAEKTAEKLAFRSAKAGLLGPDGPPGFTKRHLAVLKAARAGDGSVKGIPESVIIEAGRVSWTDYADPALLWGLEHATERPKSYPQRHRVLPTVLGNTLRTFEDRLEIPARENLEGFVLRHNDLLPETLREELAAYRNRLDMYCALVLVFSVLGLIALPTLWRAGPVGVSAACTALSYTSLAVLAYSAAVASARGYGTALVEAGRRTNQ